MQPKDKSAIERVHINEATYQNCSFEPTYINFFYGNNGVGKTTIGRVIDAKENLDFSAGRSPSDYTVLLYNQDFIEKNISTCDSLEGIFTLDEQNIEARNRLYALQNEKLRLESAIQQASESIDKINEKLDADTLSYSDNLWESGKSIRDNFPLVFTGTRRSKDAFFKSLLALKSYTLNDEKALTFLYETAFNPLAKAYTEICPIADETALDSMRNIGLVSEPVISSASSAFSDFLNSIQASDWVRNGHTMYSHPANGKCPYCQQQLPSNFEEQLTNCFDEQYKDKIDKLDALLENYKNRANALWRVIQFTEELTSPVFDLDSYKDKLEILKNLIATNITTIKSKLSEPSIPLTLEPTAPQFHAINETIAGINALLKANNEVVASLDSKKVECKDKIWQHLGALLKDRILAYKHLYNSAQRKIKEANEFITTTKGTLKDMSLEISALNSRLVNTASTVDSINILLEDSGFQGFTLKQKESDPNTYQVIRNDGSIAKKLSEGERNFIAFLYFYHKVMGGSSVSNGLIDKIVVIDDPVSSMDSSSLFIVSSLVRKLIAICQNNASSQPDIEQGHFISQIFVLTHNAYFHKEITTNYVQHYRYCNFYLITKSNNNSAIKLCVRDKANALTQSENYNPVQNSYAALWSEFKEINSIIPLLNVMRRILEYYFIQMCGYEGNSIQSRILHDNRSKFITISEDGTEDTTMLQVATSLLSYINTASFGLNSGLYFVDSCCDTQQCKKSFEMIFKYMGQEQHFNMMMGANNR